MGIRISEMEEATTFGADDYVPIVTSGTNKKALGQKIKDFIAGFFVSKSGDTMTGDLSINNTGDASFYISKSENVTLDTSANNGVTTQQVRGMRCQDKNDQRFGAVQSLAKTDGSTQLQLIARNRQTNGNYAENHIYATMNKDGSRSYEISDPAAFRSAIGVNSYLIDTFSIPLTYASSSNPYAGGYYNVAKTGYNAVGIVGYNISGESSSLCFANGINILSTEPNKVYYSIRANAAGTYTHTLNVKVLYEKI